MPSATKAVLLAAGFVWRRLAADWPDLLAEELVTGSVEEFIGRMEAGLVTSSRSLRATPSIAQGIADSLRLPLARAQGTFDASVSAGFMRITEQAAAKKWTLERYRAAIERFARTAGARYEGSWVATWHRTMVLSSVYNSGILERFGAQPTARLYPYLIYKTAEDELVRPAHAALLNFIARSTWAGWPTILPPNDWNCRCGVYPVGVLVARASGFEGDFPLNGEAKLVGWPGADPKFPKGGRPSLRAIR